MISFFIEALTVLTTAPIFFGYLSLISFPFVGIFAGVLILGLSFIKSFFSNDGGLT